MVRHVGMAHGVLWTALIFLIIDAKSDQGWTIRQSAIPLIASLLPFGPFWIDRRLRDGTILIRVFADNRSSASDTICGSDHPKGSQMNTDVYEVLSKIGPALDDAVPDNAEWKWEERFDAALVVVNTAHAQKVYAALSEACDHQWTSDNASNCSEEVGKPWTIWGLARWAAPVHIMDRRVFVRYLSSWPWNDQAHVSIRFGIFYPGGDFADGASAKIMLSRGLGIED